MRQDAPDRIIRGGPSIRSRRPPDWIIQGQVAGRHPRKEQPGRIKQEKHRHPGLDHPGTSGRGRPGLEHPGRSKQQEPLPPGLEHPGTSGGRRFASDHSGQKNEERPQPPGHKQLGKRGQTPRARLSRANQAGGAPAPWTGPEATQRTTQGRSTDAGQTMRPRRCRAA